VTQIRLAQSGDWSAIWRIVEPVFRRGDTYTFAPSITEAEARVVWMDVPRATFVAVDDEGIVLGTYYIKPNQPGGGAHVCNCGYIVSENARGKGIATRMCAHSEQQASALGFRAMQFNFVVSTNEGAARLWKRQGFDMVGTLPGAFRHPALGYVDALVMFKSLDA
jgi:L-amino acid N-acyltransferase YncA